MGHFYSFSLISSHLHPTPLYKKKEWNKETKFLYQSESGENRSTKTESSEPPLCHRQHVTNFHLSYVTRSLALPPFGSLSLSPPQVAETIFLKWLMSPAFLSWEVALTMVAELTRIPPPTLSQLRPHRNLVSLCHSLIVHWQYVVKNCFKRIWD